MQTTLHAILILGIVALEVFNSNATKVKDDDMVEYMIVYKAKKVKESSLECLHCYNGDATGDCEALTNISNIPTRVCLEGETFCKVERIYTNGKLTTFDRYCASVCEPGCRDAAIYHTCVSCCNEYSLCNTDNGAHRHTMLPLSLCTLASFFSMLLSVFILTLQER